MRKIRSAPAPYAMRLPRYTKRDTSPTTVIDCLRCEMPFPSYNTTTNRICYPCTRTREWKGIT